MTDGQELITQIRKELEPVDARLRGLRALEQNDISRECLRVIVGEQHITNRKRPEELGRHGSPL